MNTYRDPGSVGRQPFTRLAIFAIVGDLGQRQAVEAIGVQRVQERTEASAVRAIDILPPTRQLSPEQAVAELDRLGIDGVLFLILTNAYVDVYQMPGTATTTGFASVYRSSAYSGTVQYREETTYRPGARLSKPREAHELKLADMKTGSLVWISSSFTRGNAFADASVMAESMVKTAIGELIGEGLVTARGKGR
jgi:hypothetical protein